MRGTTRHVRSTQPRGCQPHRDRQEGRHACADEGQLPAVVYGHGAESEPLTVDAHEFDLLRRHVGASTLVDLAVDGKKPRPVIVQSIQVHRLTRRPIHVDLFAVRMTEELTVEVQLIGTGIAPAVETGGTLVHPTSSVKVRALPDKLPETLHYDLSGARGLRRHDHRGGHRRARGRGDPGGSDRGDRPGPGAARRRASCRATRASRRPAEAAAEETGSSETEA